MISLRRPGPDAIERYRIQRAGMTPTCVPTGRPPSGYRQDAFSREIGVGTDAFNRARTGLREWVAHSDSGVEVFPADAALAEGGTVAIVTRQLGLWILAACRIETVSDDASMFGFTYATLPGHPENGYESFVVRLENETVFFDIDVVSKPGIPLVRFGRPVTRLLQRRATKAYLASLERRTRDLG